MTAPFKSRCAQLLFGKMRHNLFGRWRSDPRDQGRKIRPHTLSGPQSALVGMTDLQDSFFWASSGVPVQLRRALVTWRTEQRRST